MRPIETIDVSRPRASTGIEKTAAVVGDVTIAVMLVLMLPLGLVVLFLPFAALVRAVLALAALL